MRIQLVSHASVIIDTGDTRIWTDPWLTSKAFNDSWSLLPAAAFEPTLLDDIEYLFITHEHPDHFNVPSLKMLPASFKERVTVLFQRKNTEKIFEAMRKFGYRNFEALPNRRVVPLKGRTELYTYQVGIMDSVVGVRRGRQSLINVNDCEIDGRDCALIRRDFGTPDVVLNQFSIAGFLGYEDYDHTMRRSAAIHRQRLLAHHRDLGARWTIPIASFMYFSSEDNRHFNRYHNTPRQIRDLLRDECVVLYPGDSWTVGARHDPEPALARFDAVREAMDDLPYDPPKVVELSEIRRAFEETARLLHERHPAPLLRLLGPVTVKIPDLDVGLRFSLARGTCEIVRADEPDLVIKSQPLHYAFRWPWGVQALGSSGRYTLKRNFRNWRGHRILFSLTNGELYLKPQFLFTKETTRYLGTRFEGGANQLVGKLQRMI